MQVVPGRFLSCLPDFPLPPSRILAVGKQQLLNFKKNLTHKTELQIDDFFIGLHSNNCIRNSDCYRKLASFVWPESQ
jgi:hypothetical protein